MEKSRKKKAEPTTEELLECFEVYLAAGHGRGRLNSGPMVFDGKVGYFCVTKGRDGVDRIKFACMPHEDIVITADHQPEKSW
jgi:hypothetical protein